MRHGSLRDKELQFFQSISSGGTVEDMKRRYFCSQTGISHPKDAERAYLRSFGAKGNSLDELWRSYLVSKGYKGTLNDMLHSFYQSGSFGSGFSPEDVPGLVLWLKNETLSSFSDDAEINQWNDSSSGGHHATQGTSTKRPLKKTVGGKPCARFDGSNDVLANTSLAAIGSGDFTFYCVLSIANTLSYRTFFKIGNAGGANPIFSNHSGSLYVNPEGSPANITDGSLTVSIVYWIRIYRSGSTTYAVRNGATEGSNDLSFTSTAGYVVGDYHSSGGMQPFGGDIYEILLYNTNISSGNKTSIETYLTNKFSL